MTGLPARIRLRVTVRGRVQGVGFRWFARELAERMKIGGWVRNQTNGNVELEAQGDAGEVQKFLSALKTQHPYARIDSLESKEIPPVGGQSGFDIR